jgi:sortase (surface protein transpeptidase)
MRSPRRRRAEATAIVVATLAASAAVLTATPRVVAALDPPPPPSPDAGSFTTVALASPAPSATAVNARPSGRFRAVRPRFEDLAKRRPPVPVEIAIPQIGVRSRIVGVGVSDGRALLLPPDARSVVWYDGGPVPGAPGSAVIAAHVDYAGEVGVFFRLRELRPGSHVKITMAGSHTRWFVVVARRVYSKPKLPASVVFRSGGAPLLTLITCGGDFDPVKRHYLANVVVYAKPTWHVPAAEVQAAS